MHSLYKTTLGNAKYKYAPVYACEKIVTAGDIDRRVINLGKEKKGKKIERNNFVAAANDIHLGD